MNSASVFHYSTRLLLLVGLKVCSRSLELDVLTEDEHFTGWNDCIDLLWWAGRPFTSVCHGTFILHPLGSGQLDTLSAFAITFFHIIMVSRLVALELFSSVSQKVCAVNCRISGCWISYSQGSLNTALILPAIPSHTGGNLLCEYNALF